MEMQDPDEVPRSMKTIKRTLVTKDHKQKRLQWASEYNEDQRSLHTQDWMEWTDRGGPFMVLIDLATSLMIPHLVILEAVIQQTNLLHVCVLSSLVLFYVFEPDHNMKIRFWHFSHSDLPRVSNKKSVCLVVLLQSLW